jgi:hypothetical protein
MNRTPDREMEQGLIQDLLGKDPVASRFQRFFANKFTSLWNE